MNNAELNALTDMVLDRMHRDFAECDCPLHQISKEERTELIDKAIEETDMEFGLDKGIRDVVVLLRDHGVRTFASCEGSEGHGFSYPMVRIDAALALSDEHQKVLAVLSNAGYSGFYIKHYFGPYSQFMEVEFWAPDCLIPTAKENRMSEKFEEVKTKAKELVALHLEAAAEVQRNNTAMPTLGCVIEEAQKAVVGTQETN